MAITLSDILFYWGHESKSLAATKGGKPTFSRPGNAYELQGDGSYVLRLSDSPRFEPNGLRLEPAATNTLTDPLEVSSSAGWFNTGLTETPAISAIASEDAFSLENTSTLNPNVRQSIGALTDEPEAFFAIVERVNTSTTVIGIYDGAGAAWVALASFNWTSGVTTLTGSSGGAAQSVGSILLTDVGPNGGELRLIWCAFTPSNFGNIGTAYIYPVGLGTSAETAIVHAAQHVESGFFTDSLVTSITNGSRVSEDLYWSGAFRPQPVVVYIREVKSVDNAGRDFTRVFGVEPVSGDFFQTLSIIRSGATYAAYINDFPQNLNASISLATQVGDVVELVLALNSDGSQRLLGSVNGGAIVAGTSAALSSGLFSEWSKNEILLNRGGGAGLYQSLKIAKLAAVTSATDGSGNSDSDLLKEMRGLNLSPDGLRISNVI